MEGGGVKNTFLWNSMPRADNAVKKRIQLENENGHKEEENDKLENQLKEDKFTLLDSERKYEDIARKFATKVGYYSVIISVYIS